MALAIPLVGSSSASAPGATRRTAAGVAVQPPEAGTTQRASTAFGFEERGASFEAVVRAPSALSPKDLAGLSPIGRRVVETLQRSHGVYRGETWDVSRGNRFEGSWLLGSPNPCQQATDPKCERRADFLYDAVREVISGAERTVVLATLSGPDRKYQEVIGSALKALDDKARARGEPVSVRLLVGKGSREGILRDVTRELGPKPFIEVSVADYESTGPDFTWNHAKILSRDGKDCVVGGHNWWAIDYNGSDAAYDVSVRVRGSAARQAEQYFEELWEASTRTLEPARLGGDTSQQASSGLVLPGAPPASRRPEPGRPGGVPVIGVGTLGGLVSTDATSDAALYAMIDAAKRVIRISTQDLVSMSMRGSELPKLKRHLCPDLVKHLAGALVDRKVRVELVLSTNDKNGYQHGWSIARTRDELLAEIFAGSRQLSPAEREAVKARLDVRGLFERDGSTARNHAKAMIVDDEAFYVGSQNFYPGGMAEPLYMQLADYGYIVDDKATTREFKAGYWDGLWAQTKPESEP